MSTEDYKRGVEDALKFPISFLGTYTAEFLTKVVEEQRKKLLTKKEIKWVNLYKNSWGGADAGPTIYDSKSSCEEGARIDYGKGSFSDEYLASVSYEIEVPL